MTVLRDTGAGVASELDSSDIAAGVASVAPYGIVNVNTVLVPEMTAVLVVVSIRMNASVTCPVCAGIVKVAEVVIVVSWLFPGQ